MRWPKRPIRADYARSGVKAFTVEKCATPERVSGCAGLPVRAPDDGRTDWFTGGAGRATRVLTRIRRDAAKRRARVADGCTGRFACSAPLFAVALVGALLLGGCSAVVQPGPACRPLETAELPMLGFISGTWMDEEQFVLVDYQSRLLVYDTARGLVRIVNGRESGDPTLNFGSPKDIRPWGPGFVLAVGYGDQNRLLELDANLRPVRVLWESDVEKANGGWSGDDVFSITQLAALRDRLYVEAGRAADAGHWEQEFAEFGADPRPSAPPGALREIAAWPLFEGEHGWIGSPSDLAATGGRAASVFALRFAPDDPYIQELVGEGGRLEAFPDLPAPFPESLRAAGGGWAGWGPLEASSYPAGLYADRDSLYVLMRDATGDAVVWDLHRIDPEQDAVVGKLRLPTNAPHVSLLTGPRYWLLLEASSGLENPFRPPIRLLLLDAASIRAGEPLSCD